MTGAEVSAAEKTQRASALVALALASLHLQRALDVLAPVAEADPCYYGLCAAQQNHVLSGVYFNIDGAKDDVDAVLRRLAKELPE